MRDDDATAVLGAAALCGWVGRDVVVDEPNLASTQRVSIRPDDVRGGALAGESGGAAIADQGHTNSPLWQGNPAPPDRNASLDTSDDNTTGWAAWPYPVPYKL